MQNPMVQFPFVGVTEDGDTVYSGVMPHVSSGWYVIAYHPFLDGQRQRPVGFLWYQEFEQAVEAAKKASVDWFKNPHRWDEAA